jgi:hypothetical protein
MEKLTVKHTPGPWVVVEQRWPHHGGGEHIERGINTAWNHPQAKGPLGVVAMSYGLGEKKGDGGRAMLWISEEDARLIAAAPELLEACEQALQRIGLYEDGADTATQMLLRAAIQKARGNHD